MPFLLTSISVFHFRKNVSMLSAPVANGVKVSLTRGMLLLLVFGPLDSIRDTFKSSFLNKSLISLIILLDYGLLDGVKL